MATVSSNGTNGHTNGTNGHTNGHTNGTNGHMNGDVHMNGKNEQEDEDGYFTCAVSVQHKRVDLDSEAGSHYSEDSLGRKVVWPALEGARVAKEQSAQHHATFASTFKGVGAKPQQDQPHKWLQQQLQQQPGMEMSQEQIMERDCEKRAWDVKQGSQRIARSRSRSKNIMERARSFERVAEEVSRPGSRAGSGYRHRSPSLGNKSQGGDEACINLNERPGSRTDTDTRRFADIGRVNTMDWEHKITGSTENIVGRTPPPKRRELKGPAPPQNTTHQQKVCGSIDKASWPPVHMEDERVLATKTPEPPPPPTRCTYPPNTLVKEHSPPFPRPPSEATNKLSEETVLQLEEEHKQDIVKQWVESTAQNAEDMAKELEKFAYDIAETVVNNMEKKSEKKDTMTTNTTSMVQNSSSSSQQTQQSSSQQTQQSQYVQSSKTEQTSQSSSAGMHMNSAGTFHAMPVQTTPKNLHGPIYVQEQNARVGMTFQQEDRRRDELRKQEESKQEERRMREQAALEQQRLFEEQQRLDQQRQLAEMEKQRQEQLRLQEEERRNKEEELKRYEESRRIEEEKRKQEELKRQEMLRFQEEQRRQQEEERRRKEEEIKRQEMIRLQEEQRRQQEEERKRKEEELKRQEMLKLQEEIKRQEMIKLQEEQRRQQEEERKRKEFEINRKIEEEKMRMEQLKKQEEELRRQEMLRVEKSKQEQEELKRQELMRYEMLKKEEEAKRLEEMRLEQEMMRQYELKQQMEKQKLLEDKKAQQLLIDQEDAKSRNRVPKTLNKAASFDHSQDTQTTNVRSNRNVSTGYVTEKRNFWMRSTSADHGLNRVDLSPAPRRRRMDSWKDRRDDRENEDPESRPGSSLGHGAQTGSVRSLSTGFLAKSKSSAAVMDDSNERGRPKRRNFMDGNNWSKEKYDQQINQYFVKTHDVKTNKVHDTINNWGQKDVTNSGRTTPVPSRGIGEVFAENRLAKNTSEAQSNSWRTKTPEPSLKLVNVVVEKAVGSNQNIQISENAEAQLAKFFSENKQVQSFSSSTNESCSFSSMSQQSNQKEELIQNGMSKVKANDAGPAGPPPAPERNQSIGVAGRYLSQ